jgi:hypothetical protein
MLYLNRCSGELIVYIDGHHVVLLTQERRTEKNIRTTNVLKEKSKNYVFITIQRLWRTHFPNLGAT